MDERQRFENWFESLGMWRAHSCAKDRDSQGHYEDPKAQHDWKVWQAALSYKHIDAREDFPWKCKTGDVKCLCANPSQNSSKTNIFDRQDIITDIIKEHYKDHQTKNSSICARCHCPYPSHTKQCVDTPTKTPEEKDV